MAADRSGRLPLNISDAVPPAHLELPDADERELSAIRLAQAVMAAPDVLPAQRDALLAHAVDLFLASRSGPLGVRFRTPAVMDRATPVPVRLHRVRPPEEVIAELLSGGPALAPLLLPQATACLVTDAEYRRLEAVSPPPTPWRRGWDRYSAADLTVVDLQDGEEFDPALPPADGGWEREQLQHLVRGGPTRICLLLACRLTTPNTTVSWAVEAAGRDAEAPTGRWLEARAAAPEHWAESARVRRAVSALTFAGRVFQSPALQRAGALLAALPAPNPSSAERARVAADLVRCGDLEDPGPGARGCRPLAVELLRGIAAGDPQQHPWEGMLEQAGEGRYAAVLHASPGDMRSSMRTVARLFDDPVLDVTLTLFEKRYRQALPEPPPAAVLQWLRDRW
ncbi:hypothetical protein ACI8AA_01170 [Geodermatophilus sp. SYSU D01180]